MFRIPRLIKIVVFAVVAFLLPLSVVNLHAQEGRKLISHPAPFYPETAKKMSIVGAVKVQVVIAPNGHIKETKVIGGHPMLVAAVEETLKNWKYAPASSETTATLEFNFHP